MNPNLKNATSKVPPHELKDPGSGGGVDTKAIDATVIETQAFEDASEPGDIGGSDTLA